MAIEIINNLWLGDYKDGLNTTFLVEKKINVIINATGNLPFVQDLNNIEKIRVPLIDEVGAKLMESNEKMEFYLEKIVEHIYKKLMLGRVILVHCRKGRQRSASLVCAFLMRYGGMNFKMVSDLMKTKKVDVFYPSCNFEIALSKFKSNK
jgi:protein-tyrosine phosphatase